MMKKLVKSKIFNFSILFILLITFSFGSCASLSKKGKKTADVAESSENSEENKENPESKKDKKNKEGKKEKKGSKSKKNKKSDGEDGGANPEEKSETADEGDKKSKKQNFTGWMNSDSRPVSYESGLVKIRILPALGSFNISAVTPSDKVIPLLSTANEYASTSFYLKIDKKVYRLTANNNVKSYAVRTDTGLRISYLVKKLAVVDVNFDCFSSDDRHDTDMIKISAEITNLTLRKSKMALKAVFDTVLGESYRYHFFTSDGMPVKNEILLSNSEEDQAIEKWIVSRNLSASLQILLRGKDVSRIDQVQLANYQTLNTRNWYPNLLTYRTFDTVRAYNNSAVGINWPSSTLSSEEKSSVTFFMAIALDEEKPNGAAFVFPEDYVEDNVRNQSVKKEVIMQIPDYIEETVKTVEPVVSVKKSPVEAQEFNSDDFEVPTVKFDVATLTAEQLEPEYIQNLINRITVLEESGLAINRAELLQLNAELDAILEILRQN